MLKVGNAMVVSLHYTLKNDAGDVVDRSPEGQPLVYLHGGSNIIEGLEDGLEDLEAGAEFQVDVPSKKGYGEVQSRLISDLPKTRFPDPEKLELGQKFVIESPQGPKSIRIVEVKEDSVVVDANHDLAGQALHFAGSIVDIREGTPHELDHGHAHGVGGHQH
jgi:FKBP-type peptidyl-prolyl cis-trans isomerase SlyD